MPTNDVTDILNDVPSTDGENLHVRVETHPKSSVLKCSILRMHEMGLMSVEKSRGYLIALMQAVNLKALTSAYITLYTNGLPTDGIEEHRNPLPYVDAYIYAHKAGILLMHPLGNLCFQAIKMHPFPKKISQGLVLLNRLGKLTEPMIKALTERKGGNSVAEAMQCLKDVGILDEDDCDFHLNKIINEITFPLEFTNIFIMLRKSGLWSDDFYAFFQGYNKKSLKKIQGSLCYLENRRLLATPLGSKYLDELTGSEESLDTMYTVLYNMSHVKTDDQNELPKYYTYLVEHANRLLASQILKALDQLGILTEDNFLRVISHERAESITYILTIFFKYRLCNPDQSASIFAHILQLDSLHFTLLQNGLILLYNNGLLREPSVRSNFNIILSWKNTVNIAIILEILRKHNSLNDQIFQSLVVDDEGASQLSVFFETFDDFELLTTDNIQRVIERLKTAPLSASRMNKLCWLLDKTDFFIGEERATNLELFLKYKNLLLSSSIFKNGLKHVPVQLRTPDVLTQMLVLATTHEGDLINAERAILVFLNQLRPEPVEIFQDDQTTHTASVHETASLSASCLKVSYEPRVFSIPHIYENAKHWLATQPHSFKKAPAQCCFERIFKTDLGLFQDPVSKINMIHLFCYIWLAIHDDSSRIQGCEVSDATKRLFDGLYEIERGGNLDVNGVDPIENGVPPSESTNQAICSAGSFNKLVETLVGVHPSVKIDFVTREVAALKFPRLVREVAMLFLVKLSKEDDQFSQDNFEKWAHEIQAMQGIPDELWELIKPEITQKMFDEFGRVYTDGIGSSAFTDMIATGMYVSADHKMIDELKALLENIRKIKASRMEEQTSRMEEDLLPDSRPDRFRFFTSGGDQNNRGEPADKIQCTM